MTPSKLGAKSWRGLAGLVRAAALAGAMTCVASPAWADADKPPRINPGETLALKKLVDRVIAGELQPGGDAWLKWSHHFLRGRDGKTYVPFTVTIDEAPTGFDSVVMYVRVVEDRPAENDGATVANLYGAAPGEVPVSVPERQFRRNGEVTAGENSAILQSLIAKPKRGLPFEDVYAATRTQSVTHVDEPHRIQRALSVAPGRYIVYAAVRERTGKDATAAPKVALLKRELEVPDFSPSRLQTSSILLARRIEALAAPLKKDEQLLRPYAFGTTEVVPSVDLRFAREQELSVTFFVYHATADASGKPNVTVEYRVYQQLGGTEKVVAATPPSLFDASTLPATFSVKAGHELAPMQTLLLRTLASGPYRLRIRVADNLSGEQLFQDVPFIVSDGAMAGVR